MMTWVAFVGLTVLCWGLYGPTLHNGQVALGSSPMRALLCVGLAYFLIGVLIPSGALTLQGEQGGFNAKGFSIATLAGVFGAVGALGIIFAFQNGGTPLYVMPLVFGGAPIVNVLVSMTLHPPKSLPSPWLFAGFVFAALGAFLVLRFKPV
jgi:hypothetical protein